MKKLTAILDRIEGERAVLIAGADGQTIVLPAKLLPENAKEGDAVSVAIGLNEDDADGGPQRAKNILNEILKT